MARKFKTVDYEQSGQQRLTIDDCLPADHLARFIVTIVAMLDLSAFYAYYAATGGEPIDPKVLLALLLYAYATGMFSSRKIEQATYEIIPFRFMAGGLHPDHSTMAWFRKQFLAEIKLVFAQVLLIAHEMGYLTVGQYQSGWEQDACRCLQEQSGQLWAVAETGSALAAGSGGVVGVG